MRLERLEISGFKSFSDRSELAFDKGVTAIVGPNGCGKSNVADAITWVMGEQSAKSLRGEKMEDVIFSGSDARKPTATAEVRLRFSGVVKQVKAPVFEPVNGNGHTNGHGNGNGNGHHADAGGRGPSGPGDPGNGHHADAGRPGPSGPGAPDSAGPGEFADVEELIQSVAREVEVTRRLYRSGESEYLIDGQIARLKDIHDLLMDTGLGAKAYAIIEQGKIGMILSTRPTDRRQLIEEAAGVTKYKARRRAAELKLEAAQQNLTRIDDIVFEVDKQRGTLKRQAAKARRYKKLRDELRRWEKLLFARRYRQLAETIESARARLAEAREREAAASARLAEVESDLGRMRIDLVEAESRATAAREDAHAREIAINRQQQQLAFDREQVQTLEARRASVTLELGALESRREPARLALAARRDAALAANDERDRAAGVLSAESDAYNVAHREIEGLEADVEAARSEVFSAINSATALRHAVEHATSAGDRVAETLSKLDVEIADVRMESERVAADRTAASEALRRAQEAAEATRIARTARESELASARIEHDWRARSVRSREQELAGFEARLKSLEELEAARAGFGDAARIVLAQANGRVGQLGAIADYLEVTPGYERAVEACLGDVLQHVVVERREQALAGLELVREQGAGRCGFLVTSDGARVESAPAVEPADAPRDGLTRLTDIVRVNGRFDETIRQAIGDAWIADTFDGAASAAAEAGCPVATLGGEVWRGAHLLTGGTPEDARGILATKRDIKELRERIHGERDALARLGAETSDLEAAIIQASNAIAALNAEHHRQEKAIVGYELHFQRATDEAIRLERKADQLARERKQAADERDTLNRRREEAHASIGRLEEDQHGAEERLTLAQRVLFEAREAAEELSQKAGDARASHAALVERASALAAEVARLEETGAELEVRAGALQSELETTRRRVEELRESIASGETSLDADVRTLEQCRRDVAAADDGVNALRVCSDDQEVLIRDARRAHESVRSVVADLDIARATAETDLSHLAAHCLDAVQATLDDVLVEVEQLERDGIVTTDAMAVVAEEEGPESDDELGGGIEGYADLARPAESVVAATQRTLSAEEAIAHLKTKIDRLGPVNMMAIEQFDELEARHAFLTTQRTDLVDSIAQTTEAIKRIDETTRQRFTEAFAAINANFQQTFSTLFGGGRAGLTLLDENDPLESGIEIIAQPPGKRLQSVQLLSGGEKALTAISLMFGLFKYKPSPFCLLDEIDAPLDDANIGRFVELLKSMQTQTQFILITHNRKTMEIANRLYGVTMEEAGVSKLISVQVN